MEFTQQTPLSKLTTFKIGGPADYFVAVSTKDELIQALDFAKDKQVPVLVLGGGSNLLVADKGLKALVVQISIKGTEVIKQDESCLEIKIGAGELWDDVVGFCVLKEYWGIENLSYIPGLVGGFPVQNVGAYGQEASQVVKEVEALDLESREISIFGKEECGFAYRQSNFNSEWKNKYVILSVTIKLSKLPAPNLAYFDLKKYFEDKKNETPTLMEIRQAVIEIRKKKFPDLATVGCAGSFFKNLILTPVKYLILEQTVEKNFPPEALAKLKEIKGRFAEQGRIKIPAAFLIDICGLKGKLVDGAKLWEKQPLVIVNEGSAKASDVVELFNSVQKIVLEKTGLKLEAEPELIGF